MAALRGERMKVMPVVVKDRLPEAGAGGDQRLVAGVTHLPFVESQKFVVLQREKTKSAGFEIIEQMDGLELQRPA